MEESNNVDEDKNKKINNQDKNKFVPIIQINSVNLSSNEIKENDELIGKINNKNNNNNNNNNLNNNNNICSSPRLLAPKIVINSPQIDNDLISDSNQNQESSNFLLTKQKSQKVEYHLNVIADNSQTDTTLKSPILQKKQNAMLLNLNNFFQCNNTNNSCSEQENSPCSSKKPNYLMKSFFNNSHSPTTERENKRNSFIKLSPIQQYFDASPKANKNENSIFNSKSPDIDNDIFNLSLSRNKSLNKSLNYSNNGDINNNIDFNFQNNLLNDNYVIHSSNLNEEVFDLNNDTPFLNCYHSGFSNNNSRKNSFNNNDNFIDNSNNNNNNQNDNFLNNFHFDGLQNNDNNNNNDNLDNEFNKLKLNDQNNINNDPFKNQNNQVHDIFLGNNINNNNNNNQNNNYNIEISPIISPYPNKELSNNKKNNFNGNMTVEQFLSHNNNSNSNSNNNNNKFLSINYNRQNYQNQHSKNLYKINQRKSYKTQNNQMNNNMNNNNLTINIANNKMNNTNALTNMQNFASMSNLTNINNLNNLNNINNINNINNMNSINNVNSMNMNANNNMNNNLLNPNFNNMIPQILINSNPYNSSSSQQQNLNAINTMNPYNINNQNNYSINYNNLTPNSNMNQVMINNQPSENTMNININNSNNNIPNNNNNFLLQSPLQKNNGSNNNFGLNYNQINMNVNQNGNNINSNNNLNILDNNNSQKSTNNNIDNTKRLTAMRSKRIANSSTLYKLDNNELIKQSHNLAKDQIGCRFLQKKIEEDTNFALTSIYPVILDHLIDTINDQFGNYLIQKFFLYLSIDQLYEFLHMISPSFSNIGINQYGTRVIQKLMDYIKNDTIKLYNLFVDLLTPNIVLFSNDINGCHIIQKVLLTKNFNNSFAYKTLIENIEKVANHKNGCCFLQKCTEKLKGDELESILEGINKKVKILIIDQYGNYVIQHVMKINGFERNNRLFNILIENLPYYSNQKFSSNVIEKFFLFDNLKNIIINKLLQPNIMEQMLLDSFGNYVVQKAINNANKDTQMKLLFLIAPLMDKLNTLNFGNKLYHKLTIQYPILVNMMISLNKDNNNNNTNNCLNNNNNNIIPSNSNQNNNNNMNFSNIITYNNNNLNQNIINSDNE